MVAAIFAVGLQSVPLSAAELTGTHNDWKTYRHGNGRELMCFAVSAAQEQQPSGAGRQTPHVYVTAWPKQGVRAEISVLLGFDVKPNSDITVDVGGSSFKLFADGDRAFVGDKGDEEQLLAAMRRGLKMTIEATPAKGGSSKDVYSLSGVTASVQAITAGCS
ncbi:MAG: invasion associated locus B family protein [Hyphomicrobiaceae bacterium]